MLRWNLHIAKLTLHFPKQMWEIYLHFTLPISFSKGSLVEEREIERVREKENRRQSGFRKGGEGWGGVGLKGKSVHDYCNTSLAVITPTIPFGVWDYVPVTPAFILLMSAVTLYLLLYLLIQFIGRILILPGEYFAQSIMIFSLREILI